MKKLFSGFVGLAMASIVMSCGQKSSEAKDGSTANVSAKDAGLKLETKDVKGMIQAGENASAGSGTMVNNEGTFEEATVNFDHKAGLSICPSKQVFDSVKAKLVEKLKIWGTFEKLEEKENVFYYKSSSDFAGKKEEGYNFLVMIKGSKRNYMITGEGENPLKPITDKALADRVYKAALSFVPAE